MSAPLPCPPNVWSLAALQEAAREDFGETEELLVGSLSQLRRWIQQSPHLHSIRQDDQVLKQFLRGCKFSLERTKEKLDNFHAVKGSLPEWYSNWDPSLPGVAELLARGVFLPLPGYDKQGRFVILSRFGRIDPKKVRTDDLLKTSNMVIGAAMEGNEQASVRGFVMVQDLSGVKASHLSLLGPATVKKLITMMETAWPVRPQANHLVNLPPVLESLMALVSSLQKEKMRQRTVVHKVGDLTKLQAQLGTEVLPREYGGEGSCVEELTQHWRKEVEARRAWLLQQGDYSTDERLRPGRPKTAGDLFGIEGSFRKLEID